MERVWSKHVFVIHMYMAGTMYHDSDLGDSLHDGGMCI